ncbi:MAG: YggT family protein [Actinobacteria bacterium]|nr:YggT family protein [Actinomycetota bacterium]MBV8396761.1 YggT family protein [Actinomycetota bacterium]
MPLFDAIGDVQQFVSIFASVYALALVLYVLLSWLRLPSALGPVQRFLYDVCEPYLRLWRRTLPLAAGPIDFSPIVAIVAVYAAARLVDFVLGKFH